MRTCRGGTVLAQIGPRKPREGRWAVLMIYLFIYRGDGKGMKRLGVFEGAP
jgi:hypothetical protein